MCLLQKNYSKFLLKKYNQCLLKIKTKKVNFEYVLNNDVTN